MNKRVSILLSMMAGAVLSVSTASATSLEQLNLNDLSTRADKIFRGTVLDVEQGLIEAGGGELPAVTYRIKVDEMIKGSADVVKGDESFVEIRMVGSIKESVEQDGVMRFSVFRDVPKLQPGSDYVLFMTPRSDIGLSVTVGLGQGAFSIVPTSKDDMAVNQFNNLGLGMGADGPVTYDSLKAAIFDAMGR